jgi:hypothetical protein
MWISTAELGFGEIIAKFTIKRQPSVQNPQLAAQGFAQQSAKTRYKRFFAGPSAVEPSSALNSL